MLASSIALDGSAPTMNMLFSASTRAKPFAERDDPDWIKSQSIKPEASLR
jgi:hypothetical protein